MQIHSLPAGGAYEQQWCSVYCCKQSRAVLMNTTLICIVQRQDEKKIPCKLSKHGQFPSGIHSYKFPLQLYRDLFSIWFESSNILIDFQLAHGSSLHTTGLTWQTLSNPVPMRTPGTLNLYLVYCELLWMKAAGKKVAGPAVNHSWNVNGSEAVLSLAVPLGRRSPHALDRLKQRPPTSSN